MVGAKRLELLHLAALEPKSSASTNSATLAGSHENKFFHVFVRAPTPTRRELYLSEPPKTIKI